MLALGSPYPYRPNRSRLPSRSVPPHTTLARIMAGSMPYPSSSTAISSGLAWDLPYPNATWTFSAPASRVLSISSSSAVAVLL